MIYLLNFLFVVFYYLLIKCLSKKNANRYFFILVTIHAILFRALANPYNYVDTLVYADAFEQISSWSFAEAINPLNIYSDWGLGYVVLNWLIGQISTETQVMFMVMAVISILPVMWFLYKTSYSLILSVTIYLIYPMFYYMGFGVIRQHIAIGFILLALFYVKNLKYSFVLAFLAFSFHTSACVFFPFYIWRHFNRGGRNVWLSLSFIVSVVIVLKLLIGYILLSFDRYRNLYDAKTEENNIVPVLFLGSFLLLLWCTKVYKRINKDTDASIIDYILYGFALSIVGIGTYGMGRMTLYFMYAWPVAITLLDKYKGSASLVFIYKITMLCLIFYLLFVSYSNYPYAYSFYWERVTRVW